MPTPTRLALFDLDHTLLSGDSDYLWCEFLADLGWLGPNARESNADIATRYAVGSVTPDEYCTFHAGLIAGRTPAELQPLRERFLATRIRPRLSADARALLARHRAAGDRLVLTTATNRVVSELTARELGVDDYLCTELHFDGTRYSGRIRGMPNMRLGKLERLREWMTQQDLPAEALRTASFYSDSINDLVLLSVVGRPVVVDPDVRLESAARRKNWIVMRLDRTLHGVPA